MHQSGWNLAEAGPSQARTVDPCYKSTYCVGFRLYRDAFVAKPRLAHAPLRATLCRMTPHDIYDTPPDVARQDTAEPGDWLSLAEAATRLQRHPRTIQRMVNAGELTKRTLRGGKVELWVPFSLASPEAD